MSDLSKITMAVQSLRAAGAVRDPDSGLWFTKAGDPLAGDPLESWRLLRKSEVRRYIDSKRAAGEAFTR